MNLTFILNNMTKQKLTNWSIFKGNKRIDNLFMSFNSLEQLKTFIRSKYYGNVSVFADNKFKCNVKCNRDNYFKREYLYK